MRKITFLMSLCLMFILGATNASAQVPTPDTDLSTAKYYRFAAKNAAAKYATAADGQTSLSTTLSKNSLWKIIADGEQPTGAAKVKFYNVGTEQYLIDVNDGTYTDFDNATTFYLQEREEVAGFTFVSTKEGWDGSFWNNFNGWGERIANGSWQWAGSADNGSQWTFDEVTVDDLVTYYNSFVSAAQAVVDGIAAENIKTDILYYSQAKIDALKDLIAADVPTTMDGVFVAVEALEKAQNNLINGPETATKYIIKGTARGEHYLTIDNNGVFKADATQATRTVWELAPVSGGYTLKNVLTGKYVSPANNADWSLVDSPVAMTLFFKDGKFVIGQNTAQGKMHERNSGGGFRIMGYTTDDAASQWELIPYTESMAADLATAEEGLMEPTVDAATPLANILGVDVDFNSISLADILAGNTHSKAVYAAAANNHYRISSATHSINETQAALGIDRAANYPCGVAASTKDVDAVWQFVPCEGGVKIYSPNYDKYIAPVIGTSNPVQDCAKMVDYTNGGLFYIEVRDAATNGIRFKGANGNYVNMEGSGNKYVLDSWFESGSYLTLAQATTLDVDIANASIGGAYATAYLPFDVTVPAGDVKAYVGADKGTYIQMTEATAVAAKNGFILEGTAAGNVTLTIGATDAATSEISGTTSAITLDDSNRSNYLLFGIGKESNQLGFYKAGDAITTIAANKAFIDNATSAALPLVFGGETTGIESVETVNANAPMFDLSGRRILAPAKGGIYIQNGKKFIVK